MLTTSVHKPLVTKTAENIFFESTSSMQIDSIILRSPTPPLSYLREGGRAKNESVFTASCGRARLCAPPPLPIFFPLPVVTTTNNIRHQKVGAPLHVRPVALEGHHLQAPPCPAVYILVLLVLFSDGGGRGRRSSGTSPPSRPRDPLVL